MSGVHAGTAAAEVAGGAGQTPALQTQTESSKRCFFHHMVPCLLSCLSVKYIVQGNKMTLATP